MNAVRDRLPECVGWVADWVKKAEDSQPARKDREHEMETVSE